MGCSFKKQKPSNDTLNEFSKKQYRNGSNQNEPQQPFPFIKINDKRTKQYGWGQFDLRPISTSTIIRRRKSTTQQNSIQA